MLSSRTVRIWNYNDYKVSSCDCIEATVQILYFNKKMYGTVPPRFELGLPDLESNVHRTEIANEQTKQMESYA